MFKPLPGKVSLQVTAPTPFDEVFVIDAGFNRVARGLGELTAPLTPGLYTIKFKSGDSVKEETVVLNKETVSIDRREVRAKGSAPDVAVEPRRSTAVSPSTVVVDVSDLASETTRGLRLLSDAGEVVRS